MRALGRRRSLSEIDFGGRKINNLQKCSTSQVVDSSFGNFYLRQTRRLSPVGFALKTQRLKVATAEGASVLKKRRWLN